MRELAVASALAEVGDRQLDLGEAHAVGVAQHRHDQPLAAADGDADVEVVVVDDVVSSISALTAGTSFEGVDGGLDEERHEAELDAVLLLEHVLVLVAQGHDGRHVDFVERGEHRRRVLRILEAARDGLPQAASSSRAPRAPRRSAPRARAIALRAPAPTRPHSWPPLAAGPPPRPAAGATA